MAQCLCESRRRSLSDGSNDGDGTWQRFADFYKRRFTRIVPVYVAVICGSLSIGRTVFLDSDFEKLRDDMVVHL